MRFLKFLIFTISFIFISNKIYSQIWMSNSSSSSYEPIFNENISQSLSGNVKTIEEYRFNKKEKVYTLNRQNQISSFVELSGEDTISARIYTYDSLGNCVLMRIKDNNGNDEFRTHIIEFDERKCISRKIFIKDSLISQSISTYSYEKNKMIKNSYEVEMSGKKQIHGKGIYENDNLIEYIFFDKNQVPERAYRYDDKGNITNKKNFTSNGFIWREINNYYKKGKISKQEIINSNHEIEETTTWTYKDDLILEEWFNSSGIKTRRTESTIDINGQIKKTKVFRCNFLGTEFFLRYKKNLEYDSNGQLIEKVETDYDNQGKLESQKSQFLKYEYDQKGNWIKKYLNNKEKSFKNKPVKIRKLYYWDE